MTRVVLVTGGTSGIGLAIARVCLERGDRVIVCGRSAVALERFRKAHPDALAVKADVTCAQDRAVLLDEVDRQFGRLDILINNAGTFKERDFTRGIKAIEGLEQEVMLNLTAPVQLTGEVLTRWPAPGAIVFVTSGYALVSPTRAPTYGAVKAGLHAFADGLRRQLAPLGTHVLELLPPMTDTPMNANAVGRKIPPAAVARDAFAALDRRRPMALPGATRLLPVLLRLAPMTTRRLVAGT